MANITSEEKNWLILLCLLIIFYFLRSFFSKNKIFIWSPITVIALTYIYYTIIGPLNTLNANETVFKNIDHREYLEIAWKGAAISFGFILLGFYAFKFKNFKIVADLPTNELLSKSRIIFLVSIFFLFLFGGFNFFTKINFLDSGSAASSESLGGSFTAYLMQSLLFFITPVLLVLKNLLEGKNRVLFWIYLVIAASIYINEAFRYRLVVLMLSVLFVYHIYLQKRLNIKLVLIIVIPFFLLMGVLEVARGYGKGINVEKASEYDSKELLENSLNETNVFFATGLIISEYDKTFANNKFDFVINTVAMPIPRAFWKNKPAGEYLLSVLSYYYGEGSGQAILNYGEYYIALGWWGIIIMSFLIGIISKYMWCWFQTNNENYLVSIIYGIFCAMMYVLVSRGYLAQYVTLLIFALLPVYIILPKNAKTDKEKNEIVR